MDICKLNIGGQFRIDYFPKGWICVDVIEGADILCDVQENSLPFEDNTVDCIYCSHMLEHVWPHKVSFVLKQFYRVLKPGAPIRLVVPNIDWFIDQYLLDRDNPILLQQLSHAWFDPRCDNKGQLIEYRHRTGFNWCTLKQYVEQAGFSSIRRRKPNESLSIFEGCDNPIHFEYSLYMEAVK